MRAASGNLAATAKVPSSLRGDRPAGERRVAHPDRAGCFAIWTQGHSAGTHATAPHPPELEGRGGASGGRRTGAMATTVEAGPRAAAQTASRYLDELDKRVLIFDGAMGTSILARGGARPCLDSSGHRSRPP